MKPLRPETAPTAHASVAERAQIPNTVWFANPGVVMRVKVPPS
jgi:hypothetical protein